MSIGLCSFRPTADCSRMSQEEMEYDPVSDPVIEEAASEEPQITGVEEETERFKPGSDADGEYDWNSVYSNLQCCV